MAGRTGAAEKILLDRAAIVTDSGQPSFLQYAVEDLASYLKLATGHEVSIGTATKPKAPTLIAIGPKTAEQILGPAHVGDKLDEEGYFLKTAAKDGVDYIVACGATPGGRKPP